MPAKGALTLRVLANSNHQHHTDDETSSVWCWVSLLGAEKMSTGHFFLAQSIPPVIPPKQAVFLYLYVIAKSRKTLWQSCQTKFVIARALPVAISGNRLAVTRSPRRRNVRLLVMTYTGKNRHETATLRSWWRIQGKAVTRLPRHFVPRSDE